MLNVHPRVGAMVWFLFSLLLAAHVSAQNHLTHPSAGGVKFMSCQEAFAFRDSKLALALSAIAENYDYLRERHLQTLIAEYQEKMSQYDAALEQLLKTKVREAAAIIGVTVLGHFMSGMGKGLLLGKKLPKSLTKEEIAALEELVARGADLSNLATQQILTGKLDMQAVLVTLGAWPVKLLLGVFGLGPVALAFDMGVTAVQLLGVVGDYFVARDQIARDMGIVGDQCVWSQTCVAPWADGIRRLQAQSRRIQWAELNQIKGEITRQCSLPLPRG